MTNDRLVVFFDGECALCNKQVQMLLRLDKKGKLSFAPLQGKSAEKVWAVQPDLRPEPGGSFDSMLAVRGLDSEEPEIRQRSDAALAIAKELGGGMGLLRVAGVLPRPLRDAGYNWIARNRYRWFGKAEECILNPGVDPARFLD